ncbi:MAG: hypothetical protein KA166_09320 [Saprospiraceae bacterium]|nr:hypothetical protein [Candidatus Opimibacter skivensis]MBP6681381.1 hypothetical protein [Saprospiraceae bacterium]
MKPDKLYLFKSALRYFLFSTIMFFGLGTLLKHYLFHHPINHETITENLITGLFMAIVFTIVFRAQWNGQDKSSIFNMPDDKTDS